jgi:hypothetical protein
MDELPRIHWVLYLPFKAVLDTFSTPFYLYIQRFISLPGWPGKSSSVEFTLTLQDQFSQNLHETRALYARSQAH